jgi:hypothetical protein
MNFANSFVVFILILWITRVCVCVCVCVCSTLQQPATLPVIAEHAPHRQSAVTGSTDS